MLAITHVDEYHTQNVIENQLSCNRPGVLPRKETKVMSIAVTSRTGLSVLVLVAGMAGLPARGFASPWPNDGLTPLYEQAAGYILNQVEGPTRGYCLVFGAGQGRLAHQLAGRSEFKVLGATQDMVELAAGRALLHKADLYGDKVTLHRESLDKLSFRDYAAVLVVCDSIISDGKCPGSAAEMFRMVRPDGGTAIIGQPPGCPSKLTRADLEKWLNAADLAYTITDNAADGLWALIKRGPLPGAGEWTHVRADVANTACSRDQRTADDWKVLWFGQPGPQIMVDRHWRNTSPLYQSGRLIIPARDRLVCSDAFNGARLWDLPIANASRLAMMRDAGWLVLAGEHVYAAVENRCLKIDVVEGKVVETFHPPDDKLDWGYLGIDGDRLIGSQQIHGASYLAANTARGAVGNQLGRGNNRRIITSRALFCRKRDSGELLWTYAPKYARIANVSICAGDGGVYFLESSNANVVSDTAGRALLKDFTEGASEHLVRLDAASGRVLWKQEHPLPAHHAIYLSYANDMLLSCSCDTQSNDFWYHLRASRAGDGSVVWNKDLPTKFGTGDTDHGKQDKHPMIVGDTVYLKQGSFELATGKPLNFTFKTTNCAECSASTKHIFGRMKGVASTWSLGGDGSARPLSPVMRPGCYTTIIPAGGIVMMPPHSAGCTCPHTIQTTVVWLPKGASGAAGETQSASP